jgi:membrane associated rhomboid family serine protease
MSPRGQQRMSFGVPPLTPGVKVLGITTLVVSVGARFLPRVLEGIAFVPEMVKHLELWRLLTYTFFSADPFGLIFSLLGLWMLGGSLEQRWGTRRFVIFYFLSGALAAAATFLVSLVAPPVAGFPYVGNWAVIEAMVAAFAVMMPDATFFLYVVPVQAKWMLPISGGITLLYMIMGVWFVPLPALFGLGAGILLAGGVSPSHFMLRARVWWIDRRLRRSKLRVVRDLGPDAKPGARGSDKYLH